MGVYVGGGGGDWILQHRSCTGTPKLEYQEMLYVPYMYMVYSLDIMKELVRMYSTCT